MDATASDLAWAMNVVPGRVSELVNEKRAISAETALRLALDTTPEFWLNLQSAYDLRSARVKSAKRIASEVRPLAKAAVEEGARAPRRTAGRERTRKRKTG